MEEGLEKFIHFLIGIKLFYVKLFWIKFLKKKILLFFIKYIK